MATRRACLLAAVLGLWAPGASLAQEPDLDSLLGAPTESAGTGSASSADVGADPVRASRQPEPGTAVKKASTAPRKPMIEEIVVTAQRTEQRLHDVPISMSVLDDEFMRQEGTIRGRGSPRTFSWMRASDFAARVRAGRCYSGLRT